ncbi:DUF4189 domain-containing protein [Dyella sp.]|uniref:DUF4189 domain-containing protein n=1 Tax=Dyella sp. TaxID=1869338 RepID=UPI002ED5D305
MVLFSGVAVAQVSAPAEVTAAAPKGTHLVFFRASGEQVGADAVAVFETAADASGAKQRDLVVFRKQASGFTVVAHNDKVIACSTCSQFHDDPFSAGQHIEVSPGHIHIEQMDSGETPSTTTFDFSDDTSARQWRVTDASRVQVKNGRGKGVTRKLPLPASGLLADMDGQWSTPTFWNALVVNDQKHTFSFLLSKPSEQAIDAAIHASSSCADGAACRVLVKQHDGCMGLARDADKTFFSATSPDPKAEDAVAKQALAACKAGGKGDCETVRTECSTGAM